MLSIRKPLVAAGMVYIGLFAASSAVHATTITQLLNVPGGTNNVSNIINDIPYNLFDSSLGTLSSVTLELATTDSVSSAVFNFNETPELVTNSTAQFPLTITGPPGLTTYLATTTISAGPFTGIAAPLTQTVIGTSTGNTDSGIVPVPSADWPANWEAPSGGVSGTDLVFSSGTGSYTGNANPGVFFSGFATVSGTLTLIYTYTPNQPNGTPEPGAWALLIASASVSLAGIRRRRAAKV